MNRKLMGLALAGSLGLAGALVPHLTVAQDAEAPGAKRGPAAADDDDDGCPGWHGRGEMGPRGRMGGHHGGRMGEEGMMGGMSGLGLGPVWRLDLSDGQRTQLRKLQADFRRANWNTIGNLIDARAKLRDLESAPQPDPKQIGAAYADVSKLRQQLLEASVQARNQALTVLTPPQRKQLDTWREEDHGPGRDFQRHAHGPGMMER